MGDWVEALLAHAGEHGLLPLHALLRCGRVSRRWWEAVRCALPTLRALDFRGCEAQVTGPDVLGVLARVAGANLAAVFLGNCQRLSAADVEQILACVAATCPNAVEIDVTGCRSRAILRAVAVRARDALVAASPLDLYVLLGALCRAGEEEEVAGGRCSFGRVCTHLRTLSAPHLMLDAEFDPEENAGDSDWEEENAGESESEAEDTPSYFDWLLVKEASEGSGWAAALLLGVSFGGEDEIARMCDCDAYDRAGRGGLHVAVERGDADMVALLLRARADAGMEDERGNTPLLLACASGHLELAQMLVGKGADASAANDQGETPLLAACTTGHLELAKMLLDKGADPSAANEQGDTPLLVAVAAGNAQLAWELAAQGAAVEAKREDGANVLALAILSQNEACIKFALTQGPKRLTRQDTLDVCAFVNRLALAFFDPANIGAWICAGAAPRALMGEIGALLSSADVDAAVKDRLEDVRAFLSHHEDLLGDRSRWPVRQAEHLVAQLASQEPDATFACEAPGALDAAMPTITIKENNTPQARRRCRWTHKAKGVVEDVAFSLDGSQLAYAADKKVVVRDFQTGLVVLQLRGHSFAVSSLAFKPDDPNILVTGSCDETIKMWDLSTCTCFSTNNVDGRVSSVAFSVDGSKIAAAFNVSKDINWDSGSDDDDDGLGGWQEGGVQIFSNEGSVGFVCQWTVSAHSRFVNAVAWSPCGRWLASGGDDSIVHLYDAQTFEVKWTLTDHRCPVTSIDWNNDGTKLASGSNDSTVKIWSVGAAGTFQCQSTLRCSPPGTWDSVTTGWDNTRRKAACVISVNWHDNCIAAGCYDGKIHLLDAAAGEIKSSLMGHTR